VIVYIKYKKLDLLNYTN